MTPPLAKGMGVPHWRTPPRAKPKPPEKRPLKMLPIARSSGLKAALNTMRERESARLRKTSPSERPWMAIPSKAEIIERLN